jgi:hypothetical protein
MGYIHVPFQSSLIFQSRTSQLTILSNLTTAEGVCSVLIAQDLEGSSLIGLLKS